MKKSIIHFSTITSTVGATYTPDQTMGPEEITGFNHLDVVCVVATLAGVTNTAGMSFYFQELFGDDYITTAKIEGITATTRGSASSNGAYIATYDPANTAATYGSPSTSSNALLGKGTLKRIVSTADANMNSVSADIYYVFWSTC